MALGIGATAFGNTTQILALVNNMLCKPYKTCKKEDISQPFGAIQGFDGKPHSGCDFAPYNGYGTFLVAPEIVYIEKVITDLDMSESLEPLKRGYGIMMRSMSTPGLYYLYWHCLPVFFVSEGDVVKQDQIVSEMGNSGDVYRQGNYVPVEERLRTKNGTHLHFEVFRMESGQKKYLDPMSLINWSIPVNYNITGVLSAVQFAYSKIRSILKV